VRYSIDYSIVVNGNTIKEAIDITKLSTGTYFKRHLDEF
jgi:hypothetical protein